MKILLFLFLILVSIEVFAGNPTEDLDDSGMEFSAMPVIGLGLNGYVIGQKGPYMAVKIYPVKIGVENDSIKAEFAGIGYAQGKKGSIIVAPIIIKVNKIGVGFDFGTGLNLGSAGLTITYSF